MEEGTGVGSEFSENKTCQLCNGLLFATRSLQQDHFGCVWLKYRRGSGIKEMYGYVRLGIKMPDFSRYMYEMVGKTG